MFSLPRPSSESGFTFVVYAMIALATATFVLNPHEQLPQWRFVGTLLALGALAVLYAVPDENSRDRTKNLRPRPLALLGLAALLVLLINGLGLHSGFTFLPFLLFLVVGHVFTNFPLPFAIVYSISVLAGWLGLLYFNSGVGGEELIANGASILVGMIFTAIFSLLTTLYREESARTSTLLVELRQAHVALQEAQNQQKALAVAQERVYLAHEIHDGLGHHLTVLNVQLQAAAKLLERDPERAAQAITACRDVAQAALREVRYSVASLRRTPLDGTSLDEATATLVADFAKLSPLQVTFTQTGTSDELVPAAALTLYRAAQEGLTNAQKYSGGTSAHVQLTFTPHNALMRVTNDGPVVTATGEGFGLVGLRERAIQLNGSLHAAPQPNGGFLLELTLPISPKEKIEDDSRYAGG
jgi:signal transduction histidine kinase